MAALQYLGRIGLWEVRLPEHIYVFSEETYRILGLDPYKSEATPENYLAAVHPEDRQKVAANIESILQSNPLFPELTHRIIWPDGEIRHAIVRTQLIRDGNTTLLFGTLQDITDAKRAEAELRKNEERFKYAAQASSDAIWDWDIRNKRAWCSENMQSLFGYACPESDDPFEPWAEQLHPEDKDRVLREIDAALKGSANSLRVEYRFMQLDGSCIDILSRAVIIRDNKGEAVRMVGALVDITERNRAEAARKENEQQIRHLAFHDSLTGLANRVLLLESVRHALTAREPQEHGGAVLLLDLDDFKALNDTFGHATGDQLLKLVALRLLTCVGKDGIVARAGGDEFVILLEHLDDENKAEATNRARMLGEKILGLFRLPFILNEHHNYFVTPSIGITLFGKESTSAENILKRADVAMYQAKASGRNTLRFFDPDMEEAVAARVALERDMREALLENQFELHYQPQFTCEGQLFGVEALLRWTHPARGPVSPAKFIPLAEKTGLIMPLGQWVLTTACTQLKRWSSMPECAGLSIAVNVSAVQLHSAGFVEQILAILEQTGADPRKLKIELTESVLVDNVEDSIAKMMVLKSRGLGFSLDDFGTGYSSLAYLKRLPLDQLKIDQSFVRDIETDQNDAAIARTIIALGHSLGLIVVAEGVENEGQRKFLDHHGCPVHQGYLLSPPLSVDRLETFAKTYRPGRQITQSHA
jgi:diguanylate cyclase (GGDEF)-like protein/PAS domain S-box-containing protein